MIPDASKCEYLAGVQVSIQKTEKALNRLLQKTKSSIVSYFLVGVFFPRILAQSMHELELR